jgi:hypothetical protein
MAKQTGLGDNLYVDGVNVSGDIGSLGRVGGGPAALDVTAIDKSAFERLGGLRDGNMDYACFFNDSTDQEHAAFRSLPRTDVQATYCRGTVLGASAASMVAKQITYDWARGQDGALTGAISMASNAYGIEWGNLLTPGIKTDTVAGNGTGVDLTTVSTAFGLQAYLHVFGITGTSATIRIQDSANNSSFTDVAGATFVAATAAGVQRIAVAGTVRQYLRVVSAGTFSSAIYAVNVIRNETAVVF